MDNPYFWQSFNGKTMPLKNSDIHTPWQIWIDTGGTFTDCIAVNPDGEMLRIKVLSSSRLRGVLQEKITPRQYRFTHNWRTNTNIFEGYDAYLTDKIAAAFAKVQNIDFQNLIIEFDCNVAVETPVDFEITAHEEAPILAARIATQTPLRQLLPPIALRLGFTKGTNALLEKKGAKVALLITKGFKDLPYIGTQQRPHLFQLDIPEPELLYHRVIEVEERLDAQGNVLTPLKEAEVQRIVAELQADPPEAVAIALLHAYRNPAHESQLGEALQKFGFLFVSLSQVLMPAIKLLPRTQTTLVNAYLSPIIHQYLQNIRSRLHAHSELLVMTSAGGLASADFFHPKDSLLSGPAGGVVGAEHIAQQLGFARTLTFDMGGTSTDAARIDGGYDYRFITKVGSFEMLSPALAIETVAAGGGSVCRFDGHRLHVGPDSAGAFPGPACYGAGGPFTITDVNLLLGKLDPSAMSIPVHLEPARAALRRIQADILSKTGIPYTEIELLQGFEKIVNEKMADAIRKISIAQGFDPKDYPLLVFGGAGGMHACKIADLLGMNTVILPYDGGLLSAFGIGQARIERFAIRQILQPLHEYKDRLSQIMAELAAQTIAALQQEVPTANATEILQQLAYLRLQGQDSTLEIPFADPNRLQEDFEQTYQQLFGHYPAERSIEVESLKVIVGAKSVPLARPLRKTPPYLAPILKMQTSPLLSEKIPVYQWETLLDGAFISGPAILLHAHCTAFIEPGWNAEMIFQQNIIVKKSDSDRSTEVPSAEKEAVELELFTNRFMAIAEQMGVQLQRTAFSVNVKERLDFSCALLDANAELLANAPHIPVHLGSLGICARLVKAKLPLNKGDVIITNHPKYGGSHLPDVTLLSAVYSEKDELIGYIVNRAHHAEIGGKRPGSMPPDAQRLLEEGVVIPPMYLIRNGVPQWEALEQLLSNAPYPTRSLAENIADINAALAALRAGEAALQKLVQQHSLAKVHYYMQRLKQMSQQTLETALQPFNNQTFAAEEILDDGHLIRVKIQIQNGAAEFDFSGSSPEHPGNLNANISIVYSVVLYVLRLLCAKDIPLNEGLMQNVRLHLPNSFLHPDFSDDDAQNPAVVGGNTEVSQRLADTLLKALGLAACSQGTMNNFLFGNDQFGYYETIGGGVGAGPSWYGRSAVHQHMTNTRITDPEELELRYPVRLREFAVRRQSGGAGRWRGGDGILRVVEFLEPLEITLLSQHRQVAPYGLQGGQPGAPGQQFLIRKSDEMVPLAGIDSQQVEPGDQLVIQTPGGGGFGTS